MGNFASNIIRLFTLAFVFTHVSCNRTTQSEISIQPTETRFVDITHHGWGSEWSFQLPEVIFSDYEYSLIPETFQPEWHKESEHHWSYEFETDDKYIQGCEKSTRMSAKNLIKGLGYKAEIKLQEDYIQMKISVRNLSDKTFTNVFSDGGCLQANSPEFIGDNEPARCFVIHEGELRNTSELDRVHTIRCKFFHDLQLYENEMIKMSRGFWGRSNDVLDLPAVISSQSKKSGNTIAIGYESSVAVNQNADDDHHCIHSYTFFGDIPANQQVTRTGYIVFGNSVDSVMNRLIDLVSN